MKSFIEHTADGVDYLVREGRGQITSAHKPVPDITKVEILVENPPEIHPAIQITFTVEVPDSNPLSDVIHQFTSTLIDYRMEWHRAPHVTASTPLTELGEDDLNVTLISATPVEEDDYIVITSDANAWAMPR